MTEEVLRELAMDSDNDMEPQDDNFFCQMVTILSPKVAMKPCQMNQFILFFFLFLKIFF